jgi:hypothetical protein
MKSDLSKSQEITIETVVSRLSQVRKAEFFNVFWGVWAANGFGTLTKKDTDLLIFGCLKKALRNDTPKSIYDWARFLRLTPARVRSIQLEAHLRFGHVLNDISVTPEAMVEQYFSNPQSVDLGDFKTKGSLDSVKINFLVEDPVVQMEIDRLVKGVGGYVNFLRNREIVVLRLEDFLKVISEKESRPLIDTWVKQKAAEKNSANSLHQRVDGSAFSQQSGTQQLFTFLDDVAAFTQVSPLIDRLKSIFSGNAERTK